MVHRAGGADDGSALRVRRAGRAPPPVDERPRLEGCRLGPGERRRPGSFCGSPTCGSSGLPAGVPANAHAAQVARAMLQRPFRAYFVGASLIPQA